MRRIDSGIGVVLKHHGERYGIRTTTGQIVGGADHGHGFARGGQLTLHERRLAVKKRAAEGVEVLLMADGYLSDFCGVAALLRKYIDRHGTLTRRELLRDVARIFDAFGESPDRTGDGLLRVLECLTDVGDIQAVRIGGRDAWARTFPRWLSLGDHQAVLLGSGGAGSLTIAAPSDNRADVVRRFDPSLQENTEAVDALGARECAYAEWFGRPGWLPLLERLRPYAPAADAPLCEVWSVACKHLEREGLPAMDENTETRVLSGPPGGYFGRHSAAHIEGRWRRSADTADGSWLAAKPGFNEAHWQPGLVRVEAGRIAKFAMLDNWDEFAWLLVARGEADGPQEQLAYEPGSGIVRLSFFAPRQLQAVLRLCGWHESAWTWRIAPGVEEWRWKFWQR
jgi:hypothetical protein